MKCSNCSYNMKQVRFCTGAIGISAYIAHKEKGIFESEKRSDIECYVCSKCGEIKFMAIKPEVFD